MQVMVVRPRELGPEEIAAWHSMLHPAGPLAHPFLCPEFTLAVGRVRPDARVAVLTDGPHTVGFFPFQRRRLGVGVPIGTGLSGRQAVVHSPGLEWDPRDLLRACRLSAWQFDCLAVEQRPLERYVTAVTPAPAISLAAGFAAYQDKLRVNSPRFCRNLTLNARKLERAAGELRFEADSRDPAHLRTLMRWKSDQYRRTGWIDFFDRPWLVDLVDDLFRARTARFQGRLSVLHAGGTLVATDFALRYGPVLAGCYSAYDPRFRAGSPGLLMHLRRTQEDAALGVQLIDLGKGNEEYKQKLKNHDLLVAEGMVTRGPLYAAAHGVRTGAVRWAGPQLRKHPRLFRTADWVLRHYGRTT